ncbi:probable transporter Mch4p [[Candida] jaroonii]|uniref:Probable transporter Mch4p n=1 Tax=[Candida] jaroonii TaxID=467808 RepID=A0ACA9Y2D0_9ASCO|nr:probable transporter Mch4p [[Candida] jaroonii]
MSEQVELQPINRQAKVANFDNEISIDRGREEDRVSFEQIEDEEHSDFSDDSHDQMNNDIPDGGLRAYMVLLGSFLGLTANFGTLNSVGAIQTYLATHQLSDVSASTLSWIFSIYLALAFSLTIVVGPYFDSQGALKPMVLGNILSFCGMMATANCKTVWQFILALSLCHGIGNSLLISPLVGVVSHWFYHKIGLAIGLSSVGGSIGGMVIPLMLRSLYAKVGFIWAIRILAFFCAALNIMATVLVKERVRSPRIDRAERISEGKRKRFIDSAKNFLDITALKDAKFVSLVLGVTFGELALLSVATYYGTYAVVAGLSESASYILLTIFNGAGIFARSCIGYLSDRIGHFNVMIVMVTLSAISILVLWLPFGTNHVILYVFISIFGFTSSSILSLTPACLRQITPVSKFGSRYGLMYFFVSIGNLFGIPIASAIIGDSSIFHYRMFALFCGLATLVGSAFWVLSRYYVVGLRLNVRI